MSSFLFWSKVCQKSVWSVRWLWQFTKTLYFVSWRALYWSKTISSVPRKWHSRNFFLPLHTFCLFSPFAFFIPFQLPYSLHLVLSFLCMSSSFRFFPFSLPPPPPNKNWVAYLLTRYNVATPLVSCTSNATMLQALSVRGCEEISYMSCTVCIGKSHFYPSAGSSRSLTSCTCWQRARPYTGMVQ